MTIDYHGLKPKRSSGKWTLLKSKVFWISAAIVVALVTLVVTDVYNGLKNYVGTIFGGHSINVMPKALFIYHDESSKFPACQLDLIVENSSSKPVSIEIRRIRLFKNEILCEFPEAELIIEPVLPGSRQKKSVNFRHEVLQQALKVPQHSSTALIEIVYKDFSTDRTDSVRLTDRDIIKCTYWQAPIFESEEEAFETGALFNEIEAKIYFTTPSGEKGQEKQSMLVYTDELGQKDINFRRIAQNIFEKHKLRIGYYLPALRRRYGGIYIGTLASDSTKQTPQVHPFDILGTADDYEMKELIGLTIDQDFSKIREFIHFTFDKFYDNSAFRLHQENANFYLLLIHEQTDNINHWITEFRNKGYRVGNKSSNLLNVLQNLVFKLPPIEKASQLADQLNNRIDSLNYIVRTDGYFVLFPSQLDSTITTRVTEDISSITGKESLLKLVFDMRPIQTQFIEAPFVTPVLVVLNFAENTLNKHFDSIKVFVP